MWWNSFLFICLNAGGGFRNVLVIGADALSRYVDWTDRGSCILFGDAAGAVVVQVIVYLHGIVQCVENIV
jgi:hypothetical protein